jgi:hypothetical protein
MAQEHEKHKPHDTKQVNDMRNITSLPSKTVDVMGIRLQNNNNNLGNRVGGPKGKWEIA